MSGFLCVPREVWEWRNKARRDAYIDLQMRCSWGEQRLKSQGQTVAVQVGEVLFSAREAALWWDCTEKAVRVVMEWLEAEGLIYYPEGKQHRRMFRVAMAEYWGEAQGARKGASRGDRRGATKGASKSHTENDLGEVGAQQKARAGAQGRAQAGAQHIGDELDTRRDVTIPTVSCEGGAGDLFGEQAPAQPPPPPEREPDAPSVIARRVVAVFHDLSKARGGRGVTDWGAQQKMAENAIKKGMTEEEATGALRWGMGEEFQRVRLRAHQMKVLNDVWSAWVEHTGGSNGRNGNGRNGSGGTSSDGGATQTGAGGGEIVLNNGRWERRSG